MFIDIVLVHKTNEGREHGIEFKNNKFINAPASHIRIIVIWGRYGTRCGKRGVALDAEHGERARDDHYTLSSPSEPHHQALHIWQLQYPAGAEQSGRKMLP